MDWLTGCRQVVGSGNRDQAHGEDRAACIGGHHQRGEVRDAGWHAQRSRHQVPGALTVLTPLFWIVFVLILLLLYRC